MLTRCAVLLTLFVLAACGDSSTKPKPAPPAPLETQTAEAVANTPLAIDFINKGVAHMGRFEFKRAEDAFAQAIEREPESTNAQLNFVIALLNQNAEGAQVRALQVLEPILKNNAANARAQYVKGLLALYLGQIAEARTALELAAAANPTDAYAAYFLGQAREQEGDATAAQTAYDNAIKLDPFLRSAWLGGQRTARALGDDARATRALEQFDALASNPRSVLAEFRYTRMGPMALARVADAPQPPKRLQGCAPNDAFGESRMVLGLVHPPPPTSTVSLQVLDIDNDGDDDCLICGWNSDGRALVVLQESSAKWIPALGHPLSQPIGVECGLFGDINGDGQLDVLLCRNGPNVQFTRNNEDVWVEAENQLPETTPNARSVDGALADLDHDGDLDVFIVNAGAPNSLLNNNGDGSWTDIANSAGLAQNDAMSKQVVIGDFDLDRDADLFILNADGPNEVYLNDRAWRYSQSPQFAALEQADLAAAVASYDTPSGRTTIRALTNAGALLNFVADNSGVWQATDEIAVQGVRPGIASSMQLLDITGNGKQELLVTHTLGMSVHGARNEFQTGYRATGGFKTLSGYIADPSRGPGLLCVAQDHGLMRLEPSEARGNFAVVSFRGATDAAQQLRSNIGGIGTRFVVRVGSTWQSGATWRARSGPGQGVQPTAIGMGAYNVIDFIEIVWPDGVLQTEMLLSEGAHTITEAQRQISSCPLVFTRAEGETEFSFVTDVLGVGGLGYLLEPGIAAPPRPHEKLLLAGPVEEVRLAEPMEEACYLDHIGLLAVDLPQGVECVLDERMAVSDPPATSEPIAVEAVRFPSSARNDRGEDMLNAVLHRDTIAATPGRLHRRFIGLLANEHTLELSFERPITECDLLLADGWVEYPYSQTNFAAWQAGERYEAPTLEAQALDGTWVTIAREFGYPAGMPRAMTLPFDRSLLPDGCTTIRLRTTQEIYWDRLRLGKRSAAVMTRTIVPARSAYVNACGFPKRSTHAQARPAYHYAERAPFGDMRHQRGRYTSYGACAPLVATVDDACAIIGPGEEVRVQFDCDALDPVADGFTRHWILVVDGWCKDMDLLTIDGETIEPLPARSQRDAGPAARGLMSRFNKREQAGH